ncbi:hypothetical protein ACETU7_14140 [Rhodococcus sp. 3Y1]
MDPTEIGYQSGHDRSSVFTPSDTPGSSRRPAQPRVFGNPSGQVCRLCDGQPGGSDIAFDHNALGGRAAGDHGRSEGCCRERCTEQAASTV